jgi:Zinc finger, C2H2 type
MVLAPTDRKIRDGLRSANHRTAPTTQSRMVFIDAGVGNGDISMPRARRTVAKTATRKTRAAKRASSKARTAAKKTASASEFVCPECGKRFRSPAGLGSHRRRAHGVVGATAKSRARSVAAGERAASAGRRISASNGGGSSRSGASAARVRRSGGSARRDGAVNRDALLQALFPNGVPPRESVIRDLNAWLDEAERLARRG